MQRFPDNVKCWIRAELALIGADIFPLGTDRSFKPGWFFNKNYVELLLVRSCFLFNFGTVFLFLKKNPTAMAEADIEFVFLLKIFVA